MPTSEAPDPAEIAAAAKRLGGLRAWHTQLKNKVKKECQFASDSPSSTALKNLVALNSQIQNNDDNIEEMFVFCIAFAADEEDSKTFNGLFDSYTSEVANMRQTLLSQISRLEKYLKPAPAPTSTAAAAARPTGANATPTVRVLSDLKPDTLTKEATPEELNEWLEQFRSYYSMSKMSGFELKNQHAFLLSCLDKELKVFLRGELNDSTPVWGATNSCASLLLGKFESFYPKFTRRLHFFGYTQAKGQTFDNFYSVLKQKGAEAALSELKTEELYTFRLLTGCTDVKLREKLMDLKDPTLKDIIAEADRFENAKSNMKTLAGQTGQTTSVSAAVVQ